MKKIYIISSGNHLFKIGVSKCPSQRLSQLQTGNPNKLKILFQCSINGADTYKVENTIHKYLKELKNKHVLNEWFRLTDDEVVNIASLLLQSFYKK